MSIYTVTRLVTVTIDRSLGWPEKTFSEDFLEKIVEHALKDLYVHRAAFAVIVTDPAAD